MSSELSKPVTDGPQKSEIPWDKLTPDEKLERRCAAWLEAKNTQFVSPEAKAAYKARVTRLVDAIQLNKIPDRLPIVPSHQQDVAQTYYGITTKQVMYDVDLYNEINRKFTLETQLDTYPNFSFHNGKVFELLEDKVYKWPGHGLPDDADGVQFLEADYMREDEYEAYFKDPSTYWLSTFLPRLWGAAEPLAQLAPISSLNVGTIGRFGLPEVRAALEKLMQAGQESLIWQKKITSSRQQLIAEGFPAPFSGSAVAPFGQFGDTLRGTRGVMRDLLRKPDMLIEAIERIVARTTKSLIAAARLGGSPILDIHLHKGSDRVLSPRQFQTFYWEPLRKVIMGVVEEGLIVHMRFEGAFNTRLETMSDLPRGRSIFLLSWETDLARAKEIVGNVACITSNVPSALVYAGTPEEIAAYCRQSIEIGAKDGGFIFSLPQEGTNRNTKPENLRAVIEAARKYDVYV